MKKNKIIVIVSIIIIIISVSSYFLITSYLEKDLAKNKKDLEKTIEKYGTVEKETVGTIIAKFNTEIMDNNMEYPASEDYSTVSNNEYWYGLYDDIYLLIVPEKYTGDKNKDITKVSAIYYEKNSQNIELALKYVKKLLKANNSNLTTAEIDNLPLRAKELSVKKENAQSKKGIALAYQENNDKVNYQVIRINK